MSVKPPFPRPSNTQGDSRLALLMRLMRRQRETGDPEIMLAEAAKAIGQHLRANRAGFFRVASDESLEFGASWADGVLKPLAGKWPASELGTHFLTEMRAGRAADAAGIKPEPTAARPRFG